MSRYLNSPREADWYACPTCGSEVRVGSSGCRQCPSDKRKEEEEAWPDGVDLPEDPEDFDYADWKKREFGAASRIKPHALPWKYWLAGILLLVAMVWAWVFAGFVAH
jgi:hypothetical protein